MVCGRKFSPEAKADVEHKVAGPWLRLLADRLEKQDWFAPETREKPLSNSMSSHRISATLKSYQKHTPKEDHRREQNLGWKMLKLSTKFPLPILGGWNQPVDRASGTCQLIWSMRTMIRNKTKLSSQQRFCRHHFMIFTNRHQPTTVESVQSLPMKFPTLWHQWCFLWWKR